MFESISGLDRLDVFFFFEQGGEGVFMALTRNEIATVLVRGFQVCCSRPKFYDTYNGPRPTWPQQANAGIQVISLRTLKRVGVANQIRSLWL